MLSVATVGKLPQPLIKSQVFELKPFTVLCRRALDSCYINAVCPSVPMVKPASPLKNIVKSTPARTMKQFGGRTIHFFKRPVD